MPNKKDRSAFVPLLFLGVLLLGAVGFVCFVPAFECQVTYFADSVVDGHEIFFGEGVKTVFWTCRECEGDFEATLLERWMKREDGVPPPGTTGVSRPGDRIIVEEYVFPK